MHKCTAQMSKGVRHFVAHWNKAYREMDAKSLAALETPDYQMIDRSGRWIRSEVLAFNENLWAMTFR
jgi:hypothetical protein